MTKAVSLYQLTGSDFNSIGFLELDGLSFVDNVNVSSAINSVYLRTILNNSSQFTSSTKTRGEVSFSNKKPWKQKGTGNARCGDRKSPLWRHGGVIFGPRPEGRSLSINRKTAKLAWANLYSVLFKENKVFCLDLSEDLSQAKAVRAMLEKFAHNTGKHIVVLLESFDMSSIRLFRNHETVCIDFYGREDFLSLATAKAVVFLKKDKSLFEAVVAKNDFI